MQFFRSSLRRRTRRSSLIGVGIVSLALVGGTLQTFGVGSVAEAKEFLDPRSDDGPLVLNEADGAVTRVSAVGFAPNETVRVFVRMGTAKVGKTRADANGMAQVDVQLPDGYVGAMGVVMSSPTAVRTNLNYEITGLLDRTGEKRVVDNTVPRYAELTEAYKQFDEKIAEAKTLTDQIDPLLANKGVNKEDRAKLAKEYETLTAIKVGMSNAENQVLIAGMSATPPAGQTVTVNLQDFKDRKAKLVSAQIATWTKLNTELDRLLVALKETAPKLPKATPIRMD